ncbi:LRR receptor-like serine/threonine-protein kinase RCH1 [Geodia barretti]|uniref:LRR receptor-like serine/threonine-protein kinase RCH1 n=1 Tax=Geodia barretti TaxID=519541 RepID=A0AA35SWX2_GEOBA|nr:LRR receptor-like serine/threonine-protein kinase RCH1 [Geodia barretti]
MSGPIPGALGSLSRLTHIVAQANDLSGEIPTELGNLSSFVWMGLHDNDLTGEIPAELGGLAKLQRLYLTNNELYGEVPEELGDLSALTNLWLNHNYLSGQIPQSLDNLERLSRLRLAGNRVETDDGTYGWGEAYTQTDRDTAITAHVERLGHYLIGRSPFNIKHFSQVAYDDFAAKRGAMDFWSALSAIEQALWDIVGKSLGVPVFDLLGGASAADRVRVDATLVGRHRKSR